MTIPVDYDNSLGLIGQTTPEQVDFIANNQTTKERFEDRDIGPLVSHVYQVGQSGRFIQYLLESWSDSYVK